uniref:Zn-dependent metallo-hydrolase RNA specificity domain-containing protein n=1 Tax=Ditylum brightwellii TaxID=49249 RepID=A0A7S4W053_9STRA
MQFGNLEIQVGLLKRMFWGTNQRKWLPWKDELNHCNALLIMLFVDFMQNRNFIQKVDPKHIILVHGQKDEMGRLMSALMLQYNHMPKVSLILGCGRKTYNVFALVFVLTRKKC